MPTTCRKLYRDIPFAHRQHRHPGRCAQVHGHNWSIGLTFACREADANGFVLDFGELHYLEAWIDRHLDHACVLAEDDPLGDQLEAVAPGAFALYRVPDPSSEGIARHLFGVFSTLVREAEGERVWLVRLDLAEDGKNAVRHEP